MPLFNAGILIRELRLTKGYTQEKLAEGICSRETIVKLENGKRKPDWIVYSNIMHRLGMKPDDFYSDIGSSGDMELINMYNEYLKYSGNSNYSGLKVLVTKAEQSEVFTKGRGRELYLQIKAAELVLNTENMRTTNEELQEKLHIAIGCIHECLCITRPDFDVDNMAGYFLSTKEMTLLKILAGAYVYLTDYEKALYISKALKESYDRNLLASIGVDQRYFGMLFNIAQCLHLLKRFEECLTICDDILDQSFGNNNLKGCSWVLNIRAICLFNLGRVDEAREEVRKDLFFRYALKDYFPRPFEDMVKIHTDMLGEKIDLSIKI